MCENCKQDQLGSGIYVSAVCVYLHFTGNLVARELKHGFSHRVFTNSLQYKNANISNFLSALPLKINWSNEECNLEM